MEDEKKKPRKNADLFDNWRDAYLAWSQSLSKYYANCEYGEMNFGHDREAEHKGFIEWLFDEPGKRRIVDYLGRPKVVGSAKPH